MDNRLPALAAAPLSGFVLPHRIYITYVDDSRRRFAMEWRRVLGRGVPRQLQQINVIRGNKPVIRAGNSGKWAAGGHRRSYRHVRSRASAREGSWLSRCGSFPDYFFLCYLSLQVRRENTEPRSLRAAPVASSAAHRPSMTVMSGTFIFSRFRH